MNFQNFKNLFRNIKTKDISARDKMEAAIAYYEGRYKDLAPEPLALKKIIENDGVPFYANPYHETEAEHYNFNSQYLIFEDFDLVTAGIKEKWRHRQQQDSEKSDLIEVPDDRLSWYPQACVCWAMIYISMTDEDLVLLHKEKELEDVVLATIYAFKDGNFSDFGLEQAVSKWLEIAVERNIITSNISNDILTERQEKNGK